MPPPKYPCIVCKTQVKDNDTEGSIKCSVCNRWQHASCSPNLTPAALDFFEATQKTLGFHYWACDGCTIGYAKLNQRIGDLSTKVELLDKAVKANTSSNQATNDKVMEVEKDVESIKVARKQDKQDIIKEAKKAWSTEQRERESRSGNLVLYGLSEAPPHITSGVERKRGDERQAGALFRAIKVTVNMDDVKFAVRLGRLTDEVVDNPRPLRFCFRSQQVREQIFENARNLPRTIFKDVSIVPDLTDQQREEDSELRDEVVRLNENMTTEDQLNWQYRCSGRRGQRVITKLRIRPGHKGGASRPPPQNNQTRPEQPPPPGDLEPEKEKTPAPDSSGDEDFSSEEEQPDQTSRRGKRGRAGSSQGSTPSTSPRARAKKKKTRRRH